MFDDLLRHDDDINEQFERFSEDKIIMANIFLNYALIILFLLLMALVTVKTLANLLLYLLTATPLLIFSSCQMT